MSEQNNKRALANRVAREVAEGGWRVESQTDEQVILYKPKKKVNHVLHLILTLLTGVWAIVWILAVVAASDGGTKILTVDEYGNVLEQ